MNRFVVIVSFIAGLALGIATTRHLILKKRNVPNFAYQQNTCILPKGVKKDLFKIAEQVYTQEDLPANLQAEYFKAESIYAKAYEATISKIALSMYFYQKQGSEPSFELFDPNFKRGDSENTEEFVARNIFELGKTNQLKLLQSRILPLKINSASFINYGNPKAQVEILFLKTFPCANCFAYTEVLHKYANIYNQDVRYLQILVPQSKQEIDLYLTKSLYCFFDLKKEHYAAYETYLAQQYGEYLVKSNKEIHKILRQVVASYHADKYAYTKCINEENILTKITQAQDIVSALKLEKLPSVYVNGFEFLLAPQELINQIDNTVAVLKGGNLNR